MLIFLDTEFTDFIDSELISLGMVSEDCQHVFYAEVEDFDRSKCSAFVQSDILPLLGQAPDVTFRQSELAIRLQTWFAAIGQPLTIAYDYITDWTMLQTALDGVLPDNVVESLDLGEMASSAAFRMAAARYHAPCGRPWHHALHDAHANRAGWLAWVCTDLQSRVPIADRRGRRHYVEIEDIPIPYRSEFTHWLQTTDGRLSSNAEVSAVRRSVWREWLVHRFSAD